MKKSNWNWYGVKIIKELNVKGEPKEELLDEEYDNTTQNFEEVTVVVKAQSFEHAYKIAEKSALSNNASYFNIYGQEVSWDFVKAVDCFLIYDEIKTGTEIYSCFYKVSKSLSTNDFMKNNIFKDIKEECRMSRRL